MMKAQLIPEAKMSSLLKQTLRNRLDTFYERVTDYTAFGTVSHQILCWEKIENEIRLRIKDNDTLIRVFEIGAGRSGFGEYLKTKMLRDKVYYTAQDVTVQNAFWLESQADNVIYGDIGEITTSNYYDIIFSTYVLEHVSDPAIHLEHIYRLLSGKGSLFIFCPRYDIPGYFCPSSRHISWITRIGFGMQWGLARINSLISRRPAFLIQTDLAAFHKPFYIDADAVHWVSLLDLILWAQSKNALIKQLRIGTPALGSKDWIVKRLLTCSVRICKPAV